MKRPSGWECRAVIVGLLGLLPALAAVPASAVDEAPGSTSVICGGQTCLEGVAGPAQSSGVSSPGAGNTAVYIPPPACVWDPVGNAQTGSRYVVNHYGGVAPPQNAPGQQYESFTQAQQMLASGETPPGEWYLFRGDAPHDTAAQQAECAGHPLWDFVVPGETLPGVALPPLPLPGFATATIRIPGAGRMYLSPASGNTRSNLPTFVRVTLNRLYDIGPGGVPYVTKNVHLGNQGVTVWVEATRLQLGTDDSSATLYTNGCGYLGSDMMVLDPKAVANTGANGTADCGVTFHQPGTWDITATLTWRTCLVPGVVNGPPPAKCTPVPGAELNPVNWARNVTVDEIQTVIGSG